MKINKIYIVSLCALFLSSCNNFLDEQPTGTMTTDSKLTSKESALALTNSAYLKNTVFNKMTPGWPGDASRWRFADADAPDPAGAAAISGCRPSQSARCGDAVMGC